MNIIRIIKLLLVGCLFAVISACANHRIPIFGADNAPLQVKGTFTPSDLQPVNPREPINIIVHRFVDGRSGGSSRRIGEIRDTFVSDMTGTDIVIDEDVADLVTVAIKRQLNVAGYHVMDGESGGSESAKFVIGGRIESFGLDVVSRDKVDMVVQTQVSDAVSGAVIWSGTVKERTDRFAGVSGNSRATLVRYLDESLQHVTEKTVNAVTASLVQSQPDLFLQAGNPTPGVSVQTAPHAHAAESKKAAPHMPAVDSGTLSIATVPTGVQVYIGDVYYGLSPLSLKLAAGIYSLRLVMDGYKDVTQKVAVRPAETTKWKVDMQH